MLEHHTVRQEPRLYSIGDFVGFVDYVGQNRIQKDSEKHWRLMQVSDSLSRSDGELLRRMQIEIYQPVTRSMIMVARKALSQVQRRSPVKPMREKIELLFPGYAFLCFVDSDDRWRDVFKMVGIRGLVCANHRPVEMPWEMVRQIQASEVNGAIPSTTKLAAFPFVIGQRIRITDGAFASFGGIIRELPKGIADIDLGELTIEQLDESFRVKLLVDLFGQQTSVELGLSQIEKV